MKISKMAPVFEHLSYTLPLNVNAANLASWLETLDPAEAYYSCGKLLRVMKSLEAENLHPDAEFSSLAAILAALERVGTKLEKPLLEAGNPVGVSERINAELMIYNYAELAERFWNLSTTFAAQQTGESAKKKIAHALFNALESLRRGLLYISFLYDRPYEGFWQLSYRIYLRAEALGVLALPIASGAAAVNDSVDNCFKSLLVFYLSDAAILTQREMKALFMLFQHRPVPIKLYPQVDAEQLALAFVFAADSDAPPTHADRQELSKGRVRYVSTIKVARLAYTNLKDETGNLDQSDAGNYSLFCKLAKVLSMKSVRKFSRVAEHRECRALFGFNNIFNYLTYKFDAVWDTTQLALVPCEEENQFWKHNGTKLPPDQQANDFAAKGNGRDKRFLFENITIINSSAKDYGVVRKDPGVPVKIGELLGVLSSADDRMELGLIRRLTHYEQLDAELGLEMISLQAGVAAIWRTGKDFDRQTVLFLPGIGALQQKDTIIFRGHAYSAGETIFMLRGNRKVAYRIDKLLHATPVFTHAELASLGANVPQE